eukprot:TRINITY_DN449_c1_g2_i1.p1 TRINITY_DN449_c1_g2~~TRINITY_DN449_c1_g2_i1.p1  ORF type:complete len:502 (+),score=195.61 TRINITY_DN449_c1_g2_i1:198-1703(+)
MTNAAANGSLLTVKVKFGAPVAAFILRKVLLLDMLRSGFRVNDTASAQESAQDPAAGATLVLEASTNGAPSVTVIDTLASKSNREAVLAAAKGVSEHSGRRLGEKEVDALSRAVESVMDGMMTTAFSCKKKRSKKGDASQDDLEASSTSSTSSGSAESGTSSRRSSSAPSRLAKVVPPTAIIEPVRQTASPPLQRMPAPPRMPISAPIAIVPVGQERPKKFLAPLRACSYAITPVSAKTSPTAKLVLGQEPWEVEVEVKQSELDLSPASTSFLRCKGFITWCRDDIKGECKWGHTCRYAHVTSKALRGQLLPNLPPIAPQMCPNDMQCKYVNEPEHQSQYRHTCRIKNCTEGLEPFHGIPFLHPNQPVRDVPRREVVLQQPTSLSSQSSNGSMGSTSAVGGSYTNSPYAEEIPAFAPGSDQAQHTPPFVQHPVHPLADQRLDTPPSSDYYSMPPLMPSPTCFYGSMNAGSDIPSPYSEFGYENVPAGCAAPATTFELQEYF